MAAVIFVLSGLISILAQTFLLRDIQLIFHGNELSIGLIISIWLLGVAAGSYFTGKLAGCSRDKNRKFLSAAFALTGAYVPLAFIFIRYVRQLFGFFPGIGLPLTYLLYFSLIVFFPLGCIVGSQFGSGVRWLECPDGSFLSGKIYLWESLGFFAGGVFFTFVLLPIFNSTASAVFIAQVSFAAAVILIKRQRIRLAIIAVILALTCLYPYSSKIEFYMVSKIYPGYDIAAIKNTPYGQLAAVKRADETFFFADGNPLETFNMPNAEIVENNVFLPLLFHGNPRSVLLIGGTGRYAPAILSYGVKTLDYVELNPWLIDFISGNAAGDYVDRFVRSEVRIRYTDGVKFVGSAASAAYDTVFVDLPYPVTLGLNRYYTREFFSSLGKRLLPGGIAVISMPGSMDYVDKYLGGMNSVIYETLKSSFKYVRIIPGEVYVYVAGDSPMPETEAVNNRYDNMIASTYYLSDKYIKYKLDPAKEHWIKGELGKYKATRFGKLILNTEFYPAGLFTSLLYEQSIFSTGMAGALRFASNFIWVPVLIIVIYILLVKSAFEVQSFTTGASAMGLQMTAIWAIQVLNGSVYYWIGLLNALFMAGAGIGTFVSMTVIPAKAGIYADKKNGSPITALGDDRLFGIIKKIDLLFIVWIIAWSLLLTYFEFSWLILFFLSFGSGALLGLQFPLLAPAEAGRRGTNEAGVASKIYSADVAGGCLAAMIGGTLIIPAWGLSGMVVMLLMLKAASLVSLKRNNK